MKCGYTGRKLFILCYFLYGFLYNAWDHNFRSSFHNHTESGEKPSLPTSVLSCLYTQCLPRGRKVCKSVSFWFYFVLFFFLFFSFSSFSVYVYVYLYYRSRRKRNVPTCLLHLEPSFLPGSTYPAAQSNSSFGFSSLEKTKAWASMSWVAWRQRSKAFH